MVEARGPAEGLRRRAADRRLQLHAAARRHRRRHRPERRRQDDAVPHDHRARSSRTAGRCELGETVQVGYVDQSRDALDADKTVWEEISGGEDELDAREADGRVARLRAPGSTSRAREQQRKVGTLSGGERNRVHLAKLLQARRQPAAARRADQRPRRRHAAGARRGAAVDSRAAPW